MAERRRAEVERRVMEPHQKKIDELENQIQRLENALRRSGDNYSVLRRENIELRAQLRVAQTGKHLVEEMLDIATEAEQAKAERDDLVKLLHTYRMNFDVVAVKNRTLAENILNKVTDSQLRRNTQPIVGVLQMIANMFQKSLQQRHSQRQSKVIELIDSDHADNRINPQMCLEQLLEAHAAATFHEMVIYLGGSAEYFANDPVLVVWEILHECERDGKPSMVTLEKLGLDWVQEHLPDPPGSLERLQKGLRIYHEQLKGGMTQAEFVRRGQLGEVSPISDTELRKYQRWAEVLAPFAMTSLEEFLSSQFKKLS